MLGWPDLSEEDKRSFYSKYACHELNFFIYQKDKTFFKKVVRKHILNKRERTFLDQWLLEEDLSAWLEPWRLQRLNVVEKILLSQRFKDRRDDLARHVGELYKLSPTPRARYDQLYRYSLMSRTLDAKGMAQVRGVQRSLREKASEKLELSDLDEPGMSRDFGRRGKDAGYFDESFKAPAVNAPAPLSAIAQGIDLKKNLKRPAKKQAGRYRIENRTRSVNGAGESFEVEKEWEESESFFLGDLKDKSAHLYRRIEPTREWIENNYYRPVA